MGSNIGESPTNAGKLAVGVTVDFNVGPTCSTARVRVRNADGSLRERLSRRVFLLPTTTRDLFGLSSDQAARKLFASLLAGYPCD